MCVAHRKVLGALPGIPAPIGVAGCADHFPTFPKLSSSVLVGPDTHPLDNTMLNVS